MKRLLLSVTLLAALVFMALRPAQAELPLPQADPRFPRSGPSESGSPIKMCLGPSATEIPCADLGEELTCGKSDIDTVSLKIDHLLSDEARHTISIDIPLRQSRDGKRYPIVRYDMETGRLTLNGKLCRIKP